MTSRHLVDPQLLPMLDVMPPVLFSRETIADVRAFLDAIAATAVIHANDGVRLTEYEASGLNGAPNVSVFVYEPERREGPLPTVYYIHGGGYFSGHPLHDQAWSRLLARELHCVVAAVHYRLSPETIYPGPHEDCYAGLLWLSQNASELGIDPAKIAIEGVSAGGGLATSLCLMARDRGDVQILFQSLVYPMLDDRTGREGVPRIGYTGEYVFTYQGNSFGWDMLLGPQSGSSDVPAYAAPARAGDLSGLPPAMICAGALDALMKENVDYAMRLIDAGVGAELHVYAGAYHGFDAFDGGKSDVGNDFRRLRVETLRRAFGEKRAPKGGPLVPAA